VATSPESKVLHQTSADRNRFSHLVEASRCLADPLADETTLATAVSMVLPYLDAWCMVDLVLDDEGVVTSVRDQKDVTQLHRIAVLHPDPAKRWAADELHRRYPPKLRGPIGVPRVLRTGKPQLVFDPTGVAILADVDDAHHAALLGELGMSSCVVAPLTVRGEILGAMTFVTRSEGRRFGGFDLQVVEELAREVAISLDKVRVRRTVVRTAVAAFVQDSTAVTARMQRLSLSLQNAPSEKAVALAVFRYSLAVVGAVNALIARLTPDGQYLEVLHVDVLPDSARDQWSRFPLSAHAPLSDVVRSGEPIYLESREAWAVDYPEYLPLLEEAGHHANAVLPLVIGGRVVGAFGAAFAQPCPFSDDIRAALMLVVQQCARALERTGLREIRGDAPTSAGASD
jgi:GAF domain-containing protein